MSETPNLMPLAPFTAYNFARHYAHIFTIIDIGLSADGSVEWLLCACPGGKIALVAALTMAYAGIASIADVIPWQPPGDLSDCYAVRLSRA